MTSHLCISVAFLDGVFHGACDGGEPEWPPSPMRVFQALLAGAHTGCRHNEWSDAKADAFRWLEQLEPPTVVAPDASSGSDYGISVPNNDSDVPGGYWAKREDAPDNKQLSNLRTIKAVRPLWLRGDTVHYVWRLTEGEGSTGQAEILCHEARHVLALGWGIDQVIGNGRILNDAEAGALPGKRWRPWNAFRPGERALRVPRPGSLADLDGVHQRFIKRLDRRLSQFNRADYLSSNTMPPRSYAAFELPLGVAFRQENVVKVAAMLRSLASRHARSDTQEFPQGSDTYVAGHTGKQKTTPERFSYLPLATIGHEHADGMIRRLLIAEPYGGSGEYARWVQNRLHSATLKDEDGNERGVLLDLWRRNSGQMLGRYVGQGTSWSTVTPIILPGFDDGSYDKAEKLLYIAFRQAGIPEGSVADITMRKAPFWPGSQHPRRYFLPDYLRGRPGWHVRLVFRETVSGPLSVGAGRHIGLGIFAHSDK